jgi:mono/diheme cytochrome c family protein
MSKWPFAIFGVFAAICVLVIPFIALGEEGDEQSGGVEVAARDQGAKDIVFENCGQCHTLAAAGIDGIVGPNLDQLLVPSGTNSAQMYEGIYTRVLQAVTCGIAGRMPKGILVGEEAERAASFVAAYAGQIGKGPTVDTATAKDPKAQGCG